MTGRSPESFLCNLCNVVVFSHTHTPGVPDKPPGRRLPEYLKPGHSHASLRVGWAGLFGSGQFLTGRSPESFFVVYEMWLFSHIHIHLCVPTCSVTPGAPDKHPGR